METSLIQPLTTDERSALERCEAVVRGGIQTWKSVSSALLEIRDRRLYRDTHPDDFDGYCRETFDIGASRGRQMVLAAGTLAALDGVTGVTPASERQIRPLLGLDQEEKRDAWADAVAAAGGVQPTTVQVEQAAAPYKSPGRVRPPEPPMSAAEAERLNLGRVRDRAAPRFRTLGPHARAVADRDLLDWERSIDELAILARKGLGDPRPRGEPDRGPFSRALARLLGLLADPSTWEACGACDDGKDRHGVACGKCRGAGIAVPVER